MNRLPTLGRTAAVVFLGCALNGAGGLAHAEAQSGGDLRAATQNPISSMYSLPFKFTFDNGADNGDANFLNIQPVLPATVGGWNLVSRFIVPLADAPGGIPGLPGNPGVGDPTKSDRTSGLGDINYSLFFNPLETKGKLIWGLGGSITAPTASDDRLGSGKWSAGPTAVGLVQPKWGTYGMLLRHLWSFAGDDDRRGVSQSLLEPFVNYNLRPRLVPDQRLGDHRRLEDQRRRQGDPAARRRRGENLQDRQPTDEHARRGLRQRDQA